MKKITRRSFLNMATITAGGLILPTSCTSKTPLTKSQKKGKIGVALLGLGGYSTYQLAPALELTQNCYLAGIVTGSPDKIPVWQKKYGIENSHTYTYDSLPEIANNPDIDVVYIVTPTGTHAKFAIEAANAGKHVWCEKPMAMNVEECQCGHVADGRWQRPRQRVEEELQHCQRGQRQQPLGERAHQHVLIGGKMLQQ